MTLGCLSYIDARPVPMVRQIHMAMAIPHYDSYFLPCSLMSNSYTPHSIQVLFFAQLLLLNVWVLINHA